MNNSDPKKPRQRDRLLGLLKARADLWIPLKDVLALGIAQYNARIFELRSLGHRIESKQEGDCSWFRLALASTAIPETSSAGRTMVHEPPTKRSIELPPATESLFRDLQPERHRDDG